MQKEKCKFRFHRGGLAESLETTIEISSKQGLCDIVNEKDMFLGLKIEPKDIKVKHYGYDARIDWDTYIVIVKGLGPIGFSNASFS